VTDTKTSNDHLMSICHKANEHAERNRSKDLFETVNRLTKKTCPTVRVIRIGGKCITNLRYADDIVLIASCNS